MNTEEDNNPKKPSNPPWKTRLNKRVKQTQVLINKDIWELKYLGSKTAKARLYLLMRILVLTIQGLQRNNLQVQSAALTFYSLIGLGPLIALGIMVSGFVLDQSSENSTDASANRAVEAITNVIAYAAPQLELSTDGGSEDNSLAPEVTEMVNSFIDSAQSGTVGVVGLLTLFAIGIQVLSSIERSFNSLWGVNKGRKLGERIFVYWTFISMGAVIGAASLTLLTVPRLEQFMGQLPFGDTVLSIILFASPIIAFLLVTLLLAAFFCFIPNTKVEWKSALLGAAIVVALLQIYLSLIHI